MEKSCYFLIDFRGPCNPNCEDYNSNSNNNN